MSSIDTTPEAAAIQVEVLRKMGVAGRVRLAVEMSEFVRDCQRAALKRQHPEYSEAQLSAALLELRYGLELR